MIGGTRTAAKIDWLQERPDKFKDTEEGQSALNGLVTMCMRNPKIDPLTPWLWREAKKRRITIDSYGMVKHDDEILIPENLAHWADWFESNSPTRRGVDIMQLKFPDFLDRISQWDEELRAKMEEEQDSYGQVVHHFDDGWSIRRLRDRDEASTEGNKMGHCVGSYGDDIERGDCQIFSLRDHKNEPHATFEVKPGDDRRYRRGFDVDNPRDWTVPDHVWEQGEREHKGVPISRIMDADIEPHEEAILDDFYRTHGFPSIEDASLVQTQGKSNAEPLPEYQEKVQDFLDKHGAKKWKKWWDDDDFKMEGHEDVASLLGDRDGTGDIEYPDNYYEAMSDAERYGVDEPEAYFGEPQWDRILNDLTSHEPLRVHRENGSIGGYWSRDDPNYYQAAPYNEQVGQRVHDIAEEYATTHEYNPETRESIQRPTREGDFGHGWWDNYKEALQDHRREVASDWDINHPDDVDIAGFHADPDVRLLNHLGPQAFGKEWSPVTPSWSRELDPWFQHRHVERNPYAENYQPRLDERATPAPENTTIPPNFWPKGEDKGYRWQKSNPPVFSHVKRILPLYYRWALAPSTGDVILSHNHEAHPARVRTHTDLAAEVNEPGASHGYAYRIKGGWRLHDYDHKAIEDPFVHAQVVKALGRREGLPALPEQTPTPAADWSMFQYGQPRG